MMFFNLLELKRMHRLNHLALRSCKMFRQIIYSDLEDNFPLVKEVRNLNHLFKVLTLSIGGCRSLIRVLAVSSLQHLQVLDVSDSEQMIAVFGSQRNTAISYAYPALRQLILHYLPKLYRICSKELSLLAWKHRRCPV